METYAIGIDFSTESGRTVVGLRGGRYCVSAIPAYADGALNRQSPDESRPPPRNGEIQEPDTYEIHKLYECEFNSSQRIRKWFGSNDECLHQGRRYNA